MSKRLIIDLETNGLLQEVTKIHCIAVVDVDSSYSKLYVGATQIHEFIDTLKKDTNITLIGHNLFCYDLMVIQKLYSHDFSTTHKIEDTLILAQLLYPDLKNDDPKPEHEWPGKLFSGREIGSHSLRAWGQRMMAYKGEYVGGWDEYNDEMGKYCIGDTYATKALFQFLESRIPQKLLNHTPIELEYAIAPILARQQAYGVQFDIEKAHSLILTLTSKLVESKWQLQEIFKPRVVKEKIPFIPKRDNALKGYKAGVPIFKERLEEFNPGSRQQIVSRLIEQFNWNPEEFTEKGNVKMNEDIIEALPFKELQPLKDYLTLNKRISQIETGTQAWIKQVKNDGRIYGSIKQNGAVTGRMTHHGPNMAQVPSNDSLYGKECRALFKAREGYVMVGCDADALEMRCLAGYLTPYDKGRFMQSLLYGKKEDGTDPHSINADAMGIERDVAKVVFYASIYGARNAKIGKILLEHGVDFHTYVENFEKEVDGMIEWVKNKNNQDKKLGNETIDRSRMYWECWVAGKECLKRFGDRIPELPLLNEKIQETLKNKGYIKGLDGRKLIIRSAHGALNTVLQSAGAIIMKKALNIADNKIKELGYNNILEYEFILNVHDEWQLEVKNDRIIVDNIANILENSIIEAGKFFHFPCPMKGNSRIGLNWSETH